MYAGLRRCFALKAISLRFSISIQLRRKKEAKKRNKVEGGVGMAKAVSGSISSGESECMRNYSRISSVEKGAPPWRRRVYARLAHKSPEEIYYNKMRCSSIVHTTSATSTTRQNFKLRSFSLFLPLLLLPSFLYIFPYTCIYYAYIHATIISFRLEGYTFLRIIFL